MYSRIAWIVGAMVVWSVTRPPVLPSIPAILQRWPRLWAEGLSPAIASSFFVNIEAVLLSTLIALPIAWLSRKELTIPYLNVRERVFEPVAAGLSKLRFLSPASFYVILLFSVSGGHAVKLWMLVLGMTFYLVTNMTNVVANIPTDAFDEARVLRMGSWTATWYVVVRGTMHHALEAIRDNAAIGWSMLMMVEGLIRSEGGMGVMLLNLQERRMEYDAGFAIILTIGLIGAVQDWCLKEGRAQVCPWVR